MLLPKNTYYAAVPEKKKSNSLKWLRKLPHYSTIERNRYYFSTLIDIAVFLATHQFALRGKLTYLKAKTKDKMNSF